ncbi:LacI family transcriptional regulator [Arthrobacter sp. SLBN-100]|uniref:LacI family DNA-binding transcriptional regulator n=1 Tax=Arthrobacter sp. SLBN-100 TaxID=2768450 RepID=UPI001153FD14|nr:LacI family DNA-binding transcriptional regulator [Arthrobacter sp. SLBN-100]TQJ62058.1 LacI family transcriptional regulator [Arthrobacter sp. SLBN-100]
MNKRLQEIAEYTGLSESTVSRVLNDRKGVATATRDAVLTAVDVLGYERPTQLRAQEARLVGVIMPQFGNPIFPAFAEAIGGHLTQRGYTPLFGVTETGGPSEAEYVQTMLGRQVAGMIFISCLHAVGHYDHGHYQLLLDRKLPVVAVDGLAPDLELSCVSTDDVQAVELAVRHLVDLGHRKIGLAISDQDHVPGARKVAAFNDCVAGIKGVEGVVDQSIYTLEGGSSAAAHLIGSGVTGIVCASDVMALGAVKAARRMGLRVPEDISVIGYDDSTMMPLVDPPMTTVRQPVEALSKAAVGLLISQIAGRGNRAGEIFFEPELVVRSSTGPALS